MEAKRVLIIPGGSSRASARYEADFTALEQEGARRGYSVVTFTHPGQEKRGGEKWQDGEYSNKTSLDYVQSVQYARYFCRDYKPNWIIGRSYGCTVAIGLLGCGDDWVRGCEGAVLWGVWMQSMAARLFDTPEKLQTNFCNRLKDAGTHVEADFFLRLPSIDNLVTRVETNLRFARGTEDKYDYREELDYLAATHKRTQPVYRREVIELEGLEHTVDPVPSGDPRYLAYREYLDCLFCPIGQKNSVET